MDDVPRHALPIGVDPRSTDVEAVLALASRALRFECGHCSRECGALDRAPVCRDGVHFDRRHRLDCDLRHERQTQNQSE